MYLGRASARDCQSRFSMLTTSIFKFINASEPALRFAVEPRRRLINLSIDTIRMI